MLFNSIEFIIFFVAVLTVITIIKHKKFQHLFIVFSSYFFFYFSSNYLLSLLIFSTLLDYYIAKLIWTTQNKQRKKILLITSLAGNLGLLGFFKYADFAIMQFNILGNQINIGGGIPFLELALPIGISFYTFQTISYTVDVYRGKLEPSKSLREFALFVAFFPQLVAGPIIRASEFLPQLREKIEDSTSKINLKQIIIHNSNLKLGITIMAFGFLKKMFFADNIAPLVNAIFTNPIEASSFEIWLGTIAFGIQIYGDFSGYSDIAIGAALILGFKIPRNFNKPYFAISPSDFWRRWHISLSSWLRDYLYIPLGGSKKGSGRTYFNLLTVMFLGGLWHGASWNFVIWGMLHGVYLVIHRVIANKFPRIANSEFVRTKTGKIISILITQYFVFLAWIPFRVHDTEGMIYSMSKYIFFDFEFDEIIEILLAYKIPIGFMIGFIILHYISFRKSDLIKIIINLKLKYWGIILAIILSLIVFFFDGNPEDFIYFRF
ncbi:alginate O-acetyltransferase [Nitrosopumilus oxyclinae]|uniref:Alginate O-acetyltransferase n=1 Tax=Nitrosopumilus oxyclinae TaxID=1959104 RepID=A0A7D5RD62_9ARCH|nr:MBOAT family protein [Nitrosopumilus oxyclinae]QLH04025.1 alginate O-acetyltransferase [Nitrosopumilus oxyclinae]